MMQTQRLSIVKEFTEPAVVKSKTYESMWCWVGTDIHEAYTALMKQIQYQFSAVLLQQIVKLIKLQQKSYMKFS